MEERLNKRRNEQIVDGVLVFGLFLIIALGVFAWRWRQGSTELDTGSGMPAMASVSSTTSTQTSESETVLLPPVGDLPPAIPKPGETGVPTPWPTIVFPPMTPVPTARNAEEAGMAEPTPGPVTPLPTPRPNDPYHLQVFGAVVVDPIQVAQEARMIVIGTVADILPARWTTSDGKRPPNPHDINNTHTLYRPIIVDVEQSLKGMQVPAQVTFFAIGGTVGQDSVKWGASDLYEFQEQERVIVYLVNTTRGALDLPSLELRDRYSVTPDRQAARVDRTLPLQELIEEIRTAIQDVPATATSTESIPASASE